MLKTRIKRCTIESARAGARLADIEASVCALNDEDLLDLADIFSGDTDGPLREMAATAMVKRNLSL